MLFDYFLDLEFHNDSIRDIPSYDMGMSENEEVISELKYRVENIAALLDYKYSSYVLFNLYLRNKDNINFDFKSLFTYTFENEKIMKKYIKLIDNAIKINKHKKKEIVFRGYNKNMNDIFRIHYENNMPYHEKGFLSTSTESFIAINFSSGFQNIIKNDNIGPVLIIDYDPKEIDSFSFDKLEKNIPQLKEYEILLERDIFIHIIKEIKDNMYICKIDKNPLPLTHDEKIKLEKKIMKQYTQKIERNNDLDNFNVKKIIKLYYILIVLDLLKIGPFNDITPLKSNKLRPDRYFKKKILKKYNLNISKEQEKHIIEIINNEKYNNFYNEDLLLYMIYDLHKNNFFEFINFKFDISEMCAIFKIKDKYNLLNCKNKRNTKLKNIFEKIKYRIKKFKIKKKDNDFAKMFSFLK